MENSSESIRPGPYADPTLPFLREKGKHTGIYLSGNIYLNVLRVVRKLKVASAYQVNLVLNKPASRIKEVLKTLFSEEYLDRLRLGNSPPLYVIGRWGCVYFRENLCRDWDVLTSLRAASSNQFCLEAGADDWEVFPGGVSDCVMVYNGIDYHILSPRLGSLEQERCEKAVKLLLNMEKRVIVVSPTPQYAVVVAKAVAADVQNMSRVRFTWDRNLSQLCRYSDGKLLVSEVFEKPPKKFFLKLLTEKPSSATL